MRTVRMYFKLLGIALTPQGAQRRRRPRARGFASGRPQLDDEPREGYEQRRYTNHVAAVEGAPGRRLIAAMDAVVEREGEAGGQRQQAECGQAPAQCWSQTPGALLARGALQVRHPQRHETGRAHRHKVQ